MNERKLILLYSVILKYEQIITDNTAQRSYLKRNEKVNLYRNKHRLQWINDNEIGESNGKVELPDEQFERLTENNNNNRRTCNKSLEFFFFKCIFSFSLMASIVGFYYIFCVHTCFIDRKKKKTLKNQRTY